MRKQSALRILLVFCLFACCGWFLTAELSPLLAAENLFQHFNNGLEHLRNQRVEAAEKSFIAATADNSEIMPCLAGQAYLKSGDYAKAASWLEKSAMKGFAPAELLLGLMSVNGQVLASSPVSVDAYFASAFKDEFPGSPEVISCMKKLADNGSHFAQLTLGKAFFFGAGVARNFESAWEHFAKADEGGNAEATYFLALMKFLGQHGDSDLNASLELLQKAVAREPRAGKLLSQIYLQGAGVKNDLEAARKYAQGKSAFLASVQFAIGDAFYFGRNTAVDHAETAKWYRMAAENESFQAARELSRAYMAGRGVEQSREETISWQEKSRFLLEKAMAEKYRIFPDQRLPAGLSAAMEYLAHIVECGFSEEQIASQSFATGEESAGNDTILAGLLAASAINHFKTKPSEQPEKALERLQTAAAMGSACAQGFLVGFYSDGQLLQPDWLQAFSLLQKAAQGGNTRAWLGLVETMINEKLHYLAAESGNSTSQFMVSQSLFKGIWGKKSAEEARKWLKMAADNENLDACFALGGAYILADGVEKNLEAGNRLLEKVMAKMPALKSSVAEVYYSAGQYDKAREIFVSAAEGDEGTAGFALGHLAKMYYSGTGVEKDLVKAAEYIGRMDYGYINAMPGLESILRDLAARKFAEAQYRLAELIKNRNGHKDNQESIELMTSAAYSGHLVSQTQLARMYRFGYDVEPDNIKAYAWAFCASAQGCEDSKSIVEFLGPMLDKEQQKQAQEIIQKTGRNKEADRN